MIKLVSDFQEFAITKMMLDCIGLVLEQDNPVFKAFLKNNMYIPPEMQEDKFLPLNDEDC